MKTFKEYRNLINEFKINKDNVKNAKIIVRGEYHLKELVAQRLKDNIKNPYLLDLDVSNCTTFVDLFSDADNDYLWKDYKIRANKIKVLDLSTWNTSNVKSMYGMFYGCRSLETIKGIENFDMRNVITIEYMFKFCHSLHINIENWNINLNVKRKEAFFGIPVSTKPYWWNEINIS